MTAKFTPSTITAAQLAREVGLTAAPIYQLSDRGQLQAPRTPDISAQADAGLAPAPEIGEHGRAILAELGIDPAEIERLAAEGALRLPDVS